MGQRNVTTTEPCIGRRCEARLRVRLAARVILRDGTSQAVLADLSCNGARLAGLKQELIVGREALLSWGRYEAFGMIVWSANGQNGMQFYEPLDRAALLDTRTLDTMQRLPDDKEQVRAAARAFVGGPKFL